MTAPDTPRLSRTPFVLLGLLTVLTPGGPLVIFLTLRGGRHSGWPPDRPIEWWTFSLCVGTFVVLLAACLSIGLIRWWRSPRALSRRGGG